VGALLTRSNFITRSAKHLWNEYTTCETREVTVLLQCLRHFNDYPCQREENKNKSSYWVWGFFFSFICVFTEEVAFLALTDMFWDSVHRYPHNFQVSLLGSELPFSVTDSQCCTGGSNFSENLCRSHGELWLSGQRPSIWFCIP